MYHTTCHLFLISLPADIAFSIANCICRLPANKLLFSKSDKFFLDQFENLCTFRTFKLGERLQQRTVSLPHFHRYSPTLYNPESFSAKASFFFSA